LTEPVAKKAGRRHWFTEGGDAEKIDSDEYLANVIVCVNENSSAHREPAAPAKDCELRPPRFPTITLPASGENSLSRG
jgi:hypothetical protein